MRLPFHIFRRLAAPLLLVVLCGCPAQGPQERLDIYLRQLASALQQPLPDPAPTLIEVPPVTADLAQDPAFELLEQLDILTLSGCAVQGTVNKYQSALGRGARPSQHLLLALEYLRLAPLCTTMVHGSTDAQAVITLTKLWHLQRQQLPRLIFNATLGGEEYRAFWQASPAAGAYPPVEDAVSLAALKAINTLVGGWLQGDYQADNRTFEILLSEVAGGQGGVLLHQIENRSNRLHTLNITLIRLLSDLPRCWEALTPTLQAAPASLPHRYFKERIQPDNAHLKHRLRALFAPVASLETLTVSALPSGYQQWQDGRHQVIAQAWNTHNHHGYLLRAIETPCADAHSTKAEQTHNNWVLSLVKGWKRITPTT